MTITFQSPAHGDVIMLDQHAYYLISLMGLSDRIPNAIEAEGVPEALANLRHGLADIQARDSDDSAETSSEGTAQEESSIEADGEASIEWQRRAWPLLQLLEAAATHETHIRWE